MSNRLTYTHDDFSSAENLALKDLDHNIKSLKNVMDKKIQAWWDIATLEQYVKNKMTPRHLCWDIGPNDGIEDSDLDIQWYNF